MKKRILCLALASIIATSSMSAMFAYAAPGEFENEISSITSQLQKMEYSYDKNSKEYKDVQNLLLKCNNSIEEYINCVNYMFEGVPGFVGVQFSESKNLNDVSENLNKYVECVKNQIKICPNQKSKYIIEIEYIQKILEYQSNYQQDLLLETQTAFNKLLETVKDDNSKSNLGKMIVNLENTINLSKHFSNNFNESVNIIKCKYSLENNDILNYIYECMQNPNVDNINRLKDVYPLVTKDYQMLIYKHLAILKNIGNELAFNATYELKGEQPPKFNVTSIDTTNGISKDQEDRIIKENEKLDKEFADVISNFEKNTSNPDKSEYPDKFFRGKLIDKECIDNIQLGDINVAGDSNLLGNRYGWNWWYLKNYKDDDKTFPTFGWKIHVTARPQSAKKIFQTVVPYLQQNNIAYKTCPSILRLRDLALNGNDQTQHGKFITIYAESDDASNNITKELDKIISEKLATGELSKSDFCELVGDAQIGNTGAIFSRYGAYSENPCIVKGGINYRFFDIRTLPIIKQDDEIDANGCPFDLPVSFLGQSLPKVADKKIANVWNDGTSLVRRKAIISNAQAVEDFQQEYYM